MKIAPLILFFTFVALVVPAPASAGTYEVIACMNDGRADAWGSAHSNGATTSYKQCPADVVVNGHAAEGMIARNTGDPFTAAPPGTNGGLAFHAPPGTRVVRLRAEAKIGTEQGDSAWRAGIEAGGRWLWCGDRPCTTFGTWQPLDLQGLNDPWVAATITCQSGGCRRDGNYYRGYIALKNVMVTVADETTPEVSIEPVGVASDGWHRGERPIAVRTADNVGIRSLEASISGKRTDKADLQCNPWTAVPCPSGEVGLIARTAEIEDGVRTVTVRAVDGAGNLGEQSREIKIDNHAPGPVRGLKADTDQWRTVNRFNVEWDAAPQIGTAPVTGAEYAICPAGQPASSLDRCARGSRDGADIRSLEDIAVPSPGDWTLRVWLEDAAGNADPASAQEVPLRFDPNAPTAAFVPPNPDDPARVLVDAADAESGVGRAGIEIRRSGERTWRELSTHAGRSGVSAVLTDEELPDGTYELRALVADRAGNERLTDRFKDGGSATVGLPVRIKTRLTVGKAARKRSKRGFRRTLVTSPSVRYGSALRLHGRLTMPGGNPLAGQPVTVFEQIDLPGAAFTAVGSGTTSKTGRFAFQVPRGPRRTFRFRYEGTPTARGHTAEVRVRVRASTSLRPNRRSVVNGEDVVFRGRLKGRPLPATSKLVQLQAFARGRWTTFANPRADPRTGLWTYRYRFTATRGRVTYRIRAVVPREASYPYETGRSRPVRIKVRGL